MGGFSPRDFRYTILEKKRNVSLILSPLYVGILHSDFSRQALLWTGQCSGHYYIPYLGFDEVSLYPHDFNNIYKERVLPSITVVQHLLTEMTGKDEPYLLLYNTRLKPATKTEPECTKYSFHVHFFSVATKNIKGFKQVLSRLTDVPRHRDWKHNDEHGFFLVNSKNAIYDCAVYGGENQLFRGPFCGKSDNTNAVLQPIQVDEKDGNFYPVQDEVMDTPAGCVLTILRSRIRAPLDETHTLLVFDPPPPEDDMKTILTKAIKRKSMMHDDGEHIRIPRDILNDVLRPLIYSEVIPAFQKFKRNLSLGMAPGGGTTPVDDIEIVEDIVGGGHTRYYKVKDDSFCLMDPKHYHSKNPHKTRIHIDLLHCTIWQFCHGCNAGGEIYHFMQTGNIVQILPSVDAEFRGENGLELCTQPLNFIARYFKEDLIYNKSRDTVYVYDAALGIWAKGKKGNGVLGMLIDELNKKYAEYKHALLKAEYEEEIKIKLKEYEESEAYLEHKEKKRDNTKQKKITEARKNARKKQKKGNELIVISATQRVKLLDYLRSFGLANEADDMNIKTHLLTMSNLKTYNVFTGEIEDIQRENLHTGVMTAELSMDLEDIKEIQEWFLEIACGDKEMVVVLQRVAGYMMTFLVHDRKGYMMIGAGNNGKGLFKALLINCLRGAFGTEEKWKAVKNKFWYKAGQSGSAENSSPETMAIADKSLLYSGDMDSHKQICAQIYKQVIASEDMGARGLYIDASNIKPTGKVLWSINNVCNLEGTDNACWERTEFLRFSAKYTNDLSTVNPAKYRFPENKARYDHIASKSDAFFTVCVQALTSYYKQQEYDPVTNAPKFLPPFPTTSSMQREKLQARARKLPLASFIQTYTTYTDLIYEYAHVDQLFDNYLVYLDNSNEQQLKKQTTKLDFENSLLTSLDMTIDKQQVCHVKITSVPERPQKITGNSFF